MRSYSEDSVLSAYIEVRDNGISICQASEKYRVPKSMLFNRLKGVPLVREANLHQQRHSPVSPRDKASDLDSLSGGSGICAFIFAGM